MTRKSLHVIFHILENDKEKLIAADIKKPSLEEMFENLTKNEEKTKEKRKQQHGKENIHDRQKESQALLHEQKALR